VSDLIAFRAPAELKERLQAEAKDRGMSMSALIVEKLDVGVNPAPRVGSSPATVGSGEDDGPRSPAGPASEVPTSPSSPAPCLHKRTTNIVGGKKCMDCGKHKKLNGGWV
jgi:hypothetical protein